MARTKQSVLATKKGKEGKGAGPRKAINTGKPKPVAGTPQRKKHRFRPGTVSLREIRRYQKSTEMLMARLPFSRLVRETAQKFSDDLRFRADALSAVQVITEATLVEIFEGAQDMACHAKRIGITPKDMQLYIRTLVKGGCRYLAPIGDDGRVKLTPARSANQTPEDTNTATTATTSQGRKRKVDTVTSSVKPSKPGKKATVGRKPAAKATPPVQEPEDDQEVDAEPSKPAKKTAGRKPAAKAPPVQEPADDQEEEEDEADDDAEEDDAAEEEANDDDETVEPDKDASGAPDAKPDEMLAD